MPLLSADPAQRQKQMVYAIAGVIVFALIVMISRRNASSGAVTPSGYSESYLENIAGTRAQVQINSSNAQLALGQAAATYLTQADQDAAAIRVAQLEGATSEKLAALQNDSVATQVGGTNYQTYVGAQRDVQVAGIGAAQQKYTDYTNYRTAVDAALPIAKVQGQAAVDVAAKNAAGQVESAKQTASAQKTSSWISGVLGLVTHFL